MKTLYKQIIIYLLVIILTVILGKNIYESYLSINDYSKLGCNGDSFDGCVKANGIEWCKKNCRDVKMNSVCKNPNSNSGDTTWGQCLKYQNQSWCQDNCTDISGAKYPMGITNM